MNNQNNQGTLKGVQANLMTGVSTLTFSNIVSPQYYNNKTRTYVRIEPNDIASCKTAVEYGATLIVPKESPDGKSITDAVKTLYKHHNIPNTGRNPVKDGDKLADLLEQKGKNGNRLRGCWQFKIGGTQIPKLFDKKGKFIPKDDYELNGKFVNIMLYVKHYKTETTEGVKIHINGIQLLDDNPDFTFSNPEGAFTFTPPSQQVQVPRDETAAQFGLNVPANDNANTNANTNNPINATVGEAFSDDDLPF